MKVVIIGAGNVATVLGRKITRAGHEIIQLIGKTKARGASTSSYFNAASYGTILEINLDADIYIIAVPDNAVSEIASQLSLGNKLVVHTAGGLSKEILKNSSRNFGVLYPLQSLRKEMETLPEIPVLVDGNSREVIDGITSFAKSWSNQVSLCNDEDRLKLHVAAVIASNFTNHLYRLAEDFCNAEHLDFRMLLPLIDETAARLKHFSPGKVQTGPAIRGDSATIQKHMEMLNTSPSIKKIYSTMTESILQLKDQ